MLEVRCRGQATLRISKEHKDRAFQILDQLCRELEREGAVVDLHEQPSEHHRYALIVRRGDGSLRISLVEGQKQTDHVLTAEENGYEARTGHSWARRYDRTPTGLLRLELLDLSYASRRAGWTETRQRRLELKIAEILAGTLEALRAQEAKQRQRDETRRQELEVEQQRARERAVKQHHDALGTNLLEMATRWSNAELITAFLDRAELRLAGLGALDGEREAWVRGQGPTS